MIPFDQYIHYGKANHGAEFQRLHHKAKEIAFVASVLCKTLFDELLTTTSIYRKKTNDSGVHEAFRAIDFAPLKNIENTYRLIDLINEIYFYYPDAPDEKHQKMKVADENPYHGTGLHIHIQVTDFTTCMSGAIKLALESRADQDKFKFQPKPLGVTT